MSNLFWLSILLCLIVGASIDTSNICLVRASSHLMLGKPGMAIGILLATAFAAIVFYVDTVFGWHYRALNWSYPNWLTVVGAAMFALGSVLNGACAVGTIGRIARGDLGHLATFAGALSVALLLPRAPIVTDAPGLALMSGSNWLFVVLGVTAVVLILGRRHLLGARLGPYVVLGVVGAVVTNWQGNWTWLGVLQHLQSGLHVQLAAFACIGAVLLGALLTAIVKGHFHLVRPDPLAMLRELVGGGLMVGGAILIPGANDALSVYGVPSGSPNAVVGYLVMFALLLAMLRVQGHFARRTARAQKVAI